MKDIWLAEQVRGGNAKNNDTDDGSHNDSKHRIESFNNDVYFYSEVSRTNNLTLNKKIDSLATKYINFSNSLGMEEVPSIRLHINSYGGSVFAAFSSVDYILNSHVPVVSIIEGCAASAATLMSVVAPHRAINKHSFMLIHQLSAGHWGKFEELKDDMANSELLMKKIKGIYQEHTKIPKKKLEEILKRDLWWDADTCLEYGLVDEII